MRTPPPSWRARQGNAGFHGDDASRRSTAAATCSATKPPPCCDNRMARADTMNLTNEETTENFNTAIDQTTGEPFELLCEHLRQHNVLGTSVPRWKTYSGGAMSRRSGTAPRRSMSRSAWTWNCCAPRPSAAPAKDGRAHQRPASKTRSSADAPQEDRVRRAGEVRRTSPWRISDGSSSQRLLQHHAALDEASACIDRKLGVTIRISWTPYG